MSNCNVKCVEKLNYRDDGLLKKKEIPTGTALCSQKECFPFIIYLFTYFLTFLTLCVCVCACVPAYEGGQKHQIPLLLRVVSSLMRVLGIELGFSGKAVHILTAEPSLQSQGHLSVRGW